MKNTLLVAALAAALSAPAHAAFYVVDDVPHVLRATTVEPPKPTEIGLSISLIPERSWLTVNGRNTLKANLEEFKTADEVKIRVYNTRPGNISLQRARGQNVRQWFLNNGVDPTKITVVDDPDSYASNDPSATTAHITLVQKNTVPSYAPSPMRNIAMVRNEPITPTQAVYLPSAKPSDPQPKAGVMNDSLKLVLVQKIISMSQNKLVKPEDAVNMLAEILRMQDGAASPSTIAPAQAPAPATTIDLPRTWTLDSTKSLRANIEDWAKIAKWEQPVWESTTSFQFPTSTLSGTYLEVLGQLANAVPSLDFKVNKTLRTLTVQENKKP